MRALLRLQLAHFWQGACGGRKTGAIFSHPICSDSIASFELQICEVSKLSAWKWAWLNPFHHLYLSTLDLIVTCQKVYLGLVLRRIPAQLGAALNNETDPISIERMRLDPPLLSFNFLCSRTHRGVVVYQSGLLTAQSCAPSYDLGLLCVLRACVCAHLWLGAHL